MTVAAGPTKVIAVKDAASHLNETVTITSKVYSIKDVGSMILVNVGAPFPDSPLTIVLRGDAKALAAQMDGKTITVSGQVVDYKGKPEIVVTDKNQLMIR